MSISMLTLCTPDRCIQICKTIDFKAIFCQHILRIFCEITLGWVPIVSSQHWFWYWVWCRQVTGHYLNQCWSRFMSPYGATRQTTFCQKLLCYLCIDILRPADAFMCQWTGTAFIQVIVFSPVKWHAITWPIAELFAIKTPNKLKYN